MIEMSSTPASKSRIRGLNYTEREKQELLTIIDKYKHIIENKKTDGTSLKEKQECWAKITIEYNSATDRKRELENLKVCYFNLKRGTKEHLAKKRRDEYKRNDIGIDNIKQFYNEMKHYAKENNGNDQIETSETDGVNYHEKTSDTDLSLLAMCEAQFEPLENLYDDGSAHFNGNGNEQESSILEGKVKNIVKQKKNITPSFKDQLTQYTNQRKKKLEDENENHKNYNTKKIELLELQIQQEKEAHEKKIKIFDLEIQIKEAELKLKLKQLEEV